MRIKATIVAYAFSVQCFKNATIVAYVGLRVKGLLLVCTQFKNQFNPIQRYLIRETEICTSWFDKKLLLVYTKINGQMTVYISTIYL